MLSTRRAQKHAKLSAGLDDMSALFDKCNHKGESWSRMNSLHVVHMHGRTRDVKLSPLLHLSHSICEFRWVECQGSTPVNKVCRKQAHSQVRLAWHHTFLELNLSTCVLGGWKRPLLWSRAMPQMQMSGNKSWITLYFYSLANGTH